MNDSFVFQRSLTPEELMLLAQRDDGRPPFDALVACLTAQLIRVAHRLVAPAFCDDLVQETWLRAWQYRHRYQGQATVLTWLCAIMRNAATSHRMWATANPDSRVAEVACVRSDADFEAVLDADRLERALEHLDQCDAQILRLRYLDRQNWSAIAHTQGLARHKVIRRHNDAKAKLRAFFLGESSGGPRRPR